MIINGYDIPDYLISEGWKFYTASNCCGTLKHKYRHPDKPNLQVDLWVRRSLFEVKKRNNPVVLLTKYDELETKLKELDA